MACIELRRILATLMNHLYDCAVCREDGNRFCNDVGSLLAIAHHELKRDG